LKDGKLSWELLKDLVTKNGFQADGVIQGPKAGCDVAVFNYQIAIKRAQEFYQSQEDVHVVFKTDPITFPTPYAFNSTIILPVGSTKEDVEKIQVGIDSECKRQQITILGGHTEISSSVNTSIISGAMIGFVPADYYVPRKIQEGDIMLCVGWCTKEGMSIIASEGFEQLKEVIGEQKLGRLMRLGENISVTDSALMINKKYQPGLMHDATEGGILGAAFETIAIENYGLELIEEKFPLTKETKEVCELLEVNPLKVISSGTLLVVSSPEKAKSIVKESTPEIPISVVGEIVSQKQGITLDGKPLAPPQSDEVIDALKKLEKGSL